MEMATLSILARSRCRSGRPPDFEATEVGRNRTGLRKRVLNVLYAARRWKSGKPQAAEGPPSIGIQFLRKLIEAEVHSVVEVQGRAMSSPDRSFEPALAAMFEPGRWSASGDPSAVGELAPPLVTIRAVDKRKPTSPLEQVLEQFLERLPCLRMGPCRRSRPFRPLTACRTAGAFRSRERVGSDCARRSVLDRLGPSWCGAAGQASVSVVSSPHAATSLLGRDRVGARRRPRRLRATCHLEFDEIISGCLSGEIDRGQLTFADGRPSCLHRGFVWDEHNRVLIAATGPGAFIDSAEM